MHGDGFRLVPPRPTLHQRRAGQVVPVPAPVRDHPGVGTDSLSWGTDLKTTAPAF